MTGMIHADRAGDTGIHMRLIRHRFLLSSKPVAQS
jgi:hypothetical protein